MVFIQFLFLFCCILFYCWLIQAWSFQTTPMFLLSIANALLYFSLFLFLLLESIKKQWMRNTPISISLSLSLSPDHYYSFLSLTSLSFLFSIAPWMHSNMYVVIKTKAIRFSLIFIYFYFSRNSFLCFCVFFIYSFLFYFFFFINNLRTFFCFSCVRGLLVCSLLQFHFWILLS